MFWKVAGFSQPSPIEQILDKDEFTLEELLDEDDIIQECKSLNGRLVAFLRERSTVEQLIRYLIDPPLDADDPKRAYKYPFTACEVFCCEVEAVFNTLLEDPELMQLLFSLLRHDATLNSKTAGYFGRVVGQLLLRKTNEVMQYLQEHPDLLQRLVQHVDTTSIAEIIKRLVGADEQSSVMFLAQYANWLADTELSDLLLGKLASDSSADAQANAADILCAIAHTQPSPLANKLAQPQSIATLFAHARAPAQQVLVPALDVCIALIEPRRSAQALEEVALQEAAYKAKAAAVETIVEYVPSLVELLKTSPTCAAVQEPGTPWALPMPYGLLAPPLGRERLKAVELLAVLLRSGSPAVEAAVIQSDAVRMCLQLFGTYPFNNLLHHCVVAMVVAILTKASPDMLKHLFEDCQLIDWIISLPTEIKPAPVPGQEAIAADKPLLRAGYMGHVTQIASTLESFSAQASEAGAMGLASGDGSQQQQQQPGAEGEASEQQDAAAAAGTAEPAPAAAAAAEDSSQASPRTQDELSAVAAAVPATGEVSGTAAYLERSAAWQTYLQNVLQPRQELENTSRWACGRPTAAELGGMDSDGDEFQAEMELEHMVGMQPVLYHRYPDDEEGEDDDDADDLDASQHAHNYLKAAGYPGAGGGGPQGVADGLGNIDLNDSSSWGPAHDDEHHMEGYVGGEKELVPFSMDAFMDTAGRPEGSQLGGSMEDDDVLLATSDEENEQPHSQEGSPTQGTTGPLQGGSPVAASSPTDAPAAPGSPATAHESAQPAAEGSPQKA